MIESLITKKIFNIKLIALYSDGTTDDLSQFIKRSRIEMNFQEYIMPYYRFILRLPKETIIKINKDRDKVVFSFASDMITTDAESESLSVPFYEEIILKPLMDLSNPVNYDDRVTRTDEDQKHLFDRYELVAISEETLKTNKPIVSGIYNNCTVSEVVTDLLSNLKNREIYLHEIDNNKIYEQIILLPANVYDNIKFIDDVYGIYNREIKMFNHETGLNILPMSGFDPNEIGKVKVEIRFPSNQTDEEIIEGSYEQISEEDDLVRNKNIVTRINNVSLVDNTRLFNELIGSEINLFGMDNESEYTKLNTYRRDMEDRNGPINKVKVYDDIYDNPYSLEKEFNNSKDIILKIQLNDIDLTMEDTFKQFDIEFFNEYYKHYNGFYELLSINQEYKTASKALVLSNYVTLRKITDHTFIKNDKNNPNT
ncbi:hypothetical protein UFVDC4_00090 [Staphylococcus phage vB_SauM-UFV_DC4]|nr:hypothetical protein UFVDC4_00090 [Staphylococcus phage vB_SauM-UFV_DC4]